MPSSRSVLFLALSLSCYLQIACFGLPQGDPDASELFRQLQASETSNSATEQLLTLSKSNPEIRRYLAGHLPSMISKGPQEPPQPWLNAIRLAGDLKIVEAAPALANWTGLFWGGPMGMSRYARIEDNPPSQALVRIGDPAIPALKTVLQRGILQQRTNAVRALFLIASPQAKAALSDHVRTESDARLKQTIEGILSK